MCGVFVRFSLPVSIIPISIYSHEELSKTEDDRLVLWIVDVVARNTIHPLLHRGGGDIKHEERDGNDDDEPGGELHELDKEWKCSPLFICNFYIF